MPGQSGGSWSRGRTAPRHRSRGREGSKRRSRSWGCRPRRGSRRTDDSSDPEAWQAAATIPRAMLPSGQRRQQGDLALRTESHTHSIIRAPAGRVRPDEICWSIGQAVLDALVDRGALAPLGPGVRLEAPACGGAERLTHA